MALFQKLFNSKKRHISVDNNSKFDLLQKCTPPKLDKTKIRLVIYSESDRGRTPYFDSNAIKPFEEPPKQNARSYKICKPVKSSQEIQSSSSSQKPPPKYHFHRLGNDVQVLEEMMFGSEGVAFKGPSLKVHLLRSPPQLMVSKVFIPEKPCREICDDESDSSSLPGSCTDFSSGEFSLITKKPGKERYARSIPVDVPSKDLLSDYSTDDDSGLASFTSSGSMRTSSYPSPTNNSLSSYSSLHRRWMRAQMTSLENHRRQQDNFVPSGRSVNRPRRHKLAIGILFGSSDENDEENYNQFQNFFFSHFALIEGHVEKMRSTIETAYFNSRNFLPSTMEALEVFRNDVYDLYMAPRLAEPVWLTMMSATSYKIKLCEKFMETFTWLVAKFDNKNCKFFVSTLLSAVLTQHLAWVATVTPAGGIPAHTYQNKHSAKWVDTLAKTHPYNPLWAQLGDLFGAIGVPRKISRTVVVGKKADIVKKVLYLLSYFIRCSEVHENTDPQCLNFIVNEPHLDVSLSPTSSEKTLIDSPCSTLGTTRITPTLSVSSSGGGRASVGGDSQNIQNSLKHSQLSVSSGEDALLFGRKPPYTCTVVNSNNSYGLEPSSRYSVCQGDVDTSSKKIIPNCKSSPLSVRQGNDELLSDQWRQKSSDLSPLQSNYHLNIPHLSATNGQVSSPEAPSIGMSELHNDIPHSLPSCSSISFEKPMLITPVAADSVSLTSSDLSGFSNSSDQVVRSQSFSGGKLRSKLAQQLETSNIQTHLEASKIKAAEVKLLLAGKSGQLSGKFDPASHKDELEVEKVVDTSAEGKKEGDTKVLCKQSSHHNRPVSLARQKSVTPTDLSRRRHLSSTGSIDYETFDPMIHCKEVKMPFGNYAAVCGQWHIRAFDRNFGRSLLAGYCDHYLSDFVLHGTHDADYRQRLLNDLQTSVKHSILDEPIDEAVCVIANTDQWTVEVASSKVMGMSPSGCTTWTSSKLVADLIESVVEISRLKMSAEFCLTHLEDRLQEIYFKSLMLSEYLKGATTYSQHELTSMLGFEPSDMPLLVAVAGTHTPGLAQIINA